jgi:hypothetical protein
VANHEIEGAPVVFESHPTYHNLLGFLVRDRAGAHAEQPSVTVGNVTYLPYRPTWA